MDGKKAVVAGHICLDITPVFPKQTAGTAGKVLVPGSLIHMDGVDVHTGGAVANTGLAMKKLGGNVRLMGKVGRDAFGGIVKNILSEYDAGDALIETEDAATSYTVALAIPGIDRIFLHDTGANDTFCKEDLDMALIRDADLFHFGYPTLMKKMYENGGEEFLSLLASVKKTEAAVSLDLAAIDPDSAAAAQDWRSILAQTLPLVDFFVPSVEELCYMLDEERYRSWKERADGRDVTEVLTMKDIEPLGNQVLELGAKAVMIKCGAPGIYYKTGHRPAMEALCERLELPLEKWADQEGFEVSYKPDAVRSGTGAGDTSIAAFLMSVLRGKSLKESVEMAAGAGACCVSAYDALSGIPSYETLEDKIRQGWEKNPYHI